jgi:hypothetical protein
MYIHSIYHILYEKSNAKIEFNLKNRAVITPTTGLILLHSYSPSSSSGLETQLPTVSALHAIAA